MKITFFINIALFVPAFFFTMRYNLHMLQLNVYKNREQLSWLKKNRHMQWLLYFAFFFGILRTVFPCLVLDIFEILTLLLIIVVYRALKKLKAKKKLVYTARVKRLIATICLLSGAFIAASVLFMNLRRLGGVLLILTALQLYLGMAAKTVNIPLEKCVNLYYINDAKRILRSVKGLKVIGVTGSYGKTSVKFFLNTLLKDRFNVLVTPESYNTPMGIVKTIRGSLKPSHEIFVCEMGARYVGDIKEICNIVKPDYGVITSVGEQHLDTFKTRENIVKTKFELADALHGGCLFLNGDNEKITEKGREYPNTVYYYTEKDGNGYRAGDISVSQLGTSFRVTAPSGESVRFSMRLLGAHNVINVLGAIAVANTLGIPLKELIIPVRRLEPYEHRMKMTEHGNVTIIDDAYNSNPAGSKAAVEVLHMLSGTRILITPGMVELGKEEDDYNYRFGTYAAKNCDFILLVGKKHTEPIRKGVLSEGFPEKNCVTFEKVEEAIAYAYAIKSEEHKYILLENDLPDNY